MMKPPKVNLYADGPPVGMLKGFSPLPHQLELDAVVPHQPGGLPGFGEFIFLELSQTAALVGRVSRYHAAGQLTTERGDAYLVDLARTEDVIPEPLQRQMLRYNLKLQLLGHLQIDPATSAFKFSVGERAFATLGGKVRLPSSAALAFLCNVGLEEDPTARPLGHLAYGQRELPDVPISFSIGRLKGKRSFVFARAGYGKSNLIKYLVSQLYSSPPDVGLLIFDPEGEYALPDAHGRPGLVNVPELRQRISLYSNRQVQADYSFLAKGNVFVDFGDFFPQDIVSAFVAPEKQDMVFANLVRSLDWKIWKQMVALLARDGFATDNAALGKLLAYKPRQDDVSLGAIKNNLVPAIKRLHRTGSTLGKNIVEELRQNRVIIVDLSLFGGEDGLAISALLLRRIFQHNVRHLTDLSGGSVRCLAVLEEAQTMLSERALDDRNIFVRWVKEGRKYGLGAILVTQQPGAISNQIISQGDNFFALHLLNETDLQVLKRHNAHFSDEILNFIRSEPIPGNCYFWSAPNQPFVLPVRVRNFETVCKPVPSAARTAPSSVPMEQLHSLVPDAIRQALCGNERLWLYRVATLDGKREPGWVACSVDYLRNIVAQGISESALFKHAADGRGQLWLQNDLPREIASCMARYQARTGYAVLEGITRPVWALPGTHVKLRGKSLRTGPVAVMDRVP